MNKDPEKTNEEVFMEEFVPRIGLSREEMQPILTDFYTNDFGLLGKYTRREPLARKIINLAHEKGLELIIATNPVFPRRLSTGYAGQVSGFPYTLIQPMKTCTSASRTGNTRGGSLLTGRKLVNAS